jgi:para-nitrobenzyl esterase
VLKTTDRPALATIVSLHIIASTLAAQTVRGPVAMFDGVSFAGTPFATGGAEFRGVPYAAPPVGALRWAPTRRVTLDTRRTHDATRFGPACPQGNSLSSFVRNIAAAFGRADSVRITTPVTSEDCLTLNIWTPDRSPDARRPVMVWIHGGSNITGQGSSDVYNGANLAARGVVVVTINYRLGALGFLAHPALATESAQRASGNYALLDQIEALRWVQRNIQSVGGDPARVTVFGESAGSFDIMHLLASPLSTGLIHRAITQSGAPMATMPTRAQAESLGLVFASRVLRDTTHSVLTALRALSADSVVAATARMQIEASDFAGPVIDGHVLIDATGKRFDTGRILPVPMLTGSNALEMSSLRGYVPQFPRTVANYSAWLSRSFGLIAPRLLALYPAASDADVVPALLRVTTDLYMTCPTRFAARGVARTGQPSYLYYFTRVIPGGESLGAYHSAELGYVFGNRESWLPAQPEDFALSNTMQQYWVQFATTGDPNVSGLPAWPAHAENADQSLELGTPVSARTGVQKPACDLVQFALRAMLK